MTDTFDFPVVGYAEALKYVDWRRDPVGPPQTAPEPQFDQAPVSNHSGVDLLSSLDDLMEKVRLGHHQALSRGRTAEKREQRDQLEAELCEAVYHCLRELPTAILTSIGFWRFLSTRPEMFEFAAWRDEDLKHPGKVPGNASFGLSSPNSVDRDTVPWRMFNRALISFEASKANGRPPMETAGFVGSEQWKSHTLRVSTSYAPVYVAAILHSLGSKEGSLKPSDIREGGRAKTKLNFPKRVTRLNTNIVPEILGPHEANLTVDREVDRLRRARAAARERAELVES
jgi:hypothetical protein